MISYYLQAPNGHRLWQRPFGTAAVFLSLSAYVLTTKKDFSFMGGFCLQAHHCATRVNRLIFFQVPALSLALSAMLVLLAAGYILFDTSRIIHGGETNYVMATVALYVDIYMLFTNLLALLGVFSGDE